MTSSGIVAAGKACLDNALEKSREIFGFQINLFPLQVADALRQCCRIIPCKVKLRVSGKFGELRQNLLNAAVVVQENVFLAVPHECQYVNRSTHLRLSPTKPLQEDFLLPFVSDSTAVSFETFKDSVKVNAERFTSAVTNTADPLSPAIHARMPLRILSPQSQLLSFSRKERHESR
jgi:hypothetical protein